MAGEIEDIDAFARLSLEDAYSRFLEMALQIEELQESRSEYEAELEAEISQAELEAKVAKLEAEALTAMLEKQSAQAEQQKNELNARIRAAEFSRAELAQLVQTLTARTVNLERKQDQLDELNRALKQQIDDKDIRLEELEDEIALIGADLSDRVHELEVANNDLWKARQRRRLTMEGQLPPNGRKRMDTDASAYKEMVAKLELESVVDDLKSAQEKLKLMDEYIPKNLALESEVKELRAQLAEEQARQLRREEDAKMRDNVRMEQLRQAEIDRSEVLALRAAIEERAQAKQELATLTNLVGGSSNEADAARLGELKAKLETQTRERNKAVARRKQHRLMEPSEPAMPRGSTSAQFASLSPSLSFFAQGLRSNLFERRIPKAIGDDMGQGRPDPFKIRYIYVVQHMFPNSECKTIAISKAMTSFQKLLETVTRTFVFDAGPCRRLYYIDQEKESFTKLDRLDRVEDRAHYLAVGPEPFNPVAWDPGSIPRNCFTCDGKNHVTSRRSAGRDDNDEPRASHIGLTLAALGGGDPLSRRRGSGCSDVSNASRTSASSNSGLRLQPREASSGTIIIRKEKVLSPSERLSPSLTASAAAVAMAAAMEKRAEGGASEAGLSPRQRNSPGSARARIQGHRALSLPFPINPLSPSGSSEGPPPPPNDIAPEPTIKPEGRAEENPKALSPPDPGPRYEMRRSGSKTRLAFGKAVPDISPPSRARSKSPRPARD